MSLEPQNPTGSGLLDELVWRHDSAFWLAWVLPLIVLAAVFAHRRVVRAAEQFAGRTMSPRLLPPLAAKGPAQKTACFVLGLALAIVAAAAPAFGVIYRPTVARGLDLCVVLDVSRSMLADDAGDTRLARARSAIRWLVDGLDGDRVGLLLFAGQTLQTCPLTLDRGFFHAALAAADPGLVGRGGTKIGPALDEALRMLDTSWDRDKLVLLVTDGGDQESFPKTAAERLREKQIRVISLGLGRADEGAALVIDGKIVRQQDGQAVSARLNDALLKELALTTEGMYVPPESAHRLPELYDQHFANLRRGRHDELQEKLHRERYQLFLAPALLLLLWQAGRAAYPRRRVQPERIASVPARSATIRTPTVTLVLLALLGLSGACRHEASAVETAIAQLAAGDAEAAERSLLALGDELRRDPVLAYDLACVHQARGRASEARARYDEALDRGDRKLRARVHANRALLSVERLRALAGDEVAAVPAGAREELVAVAESALDDLQRARDLDPSLASAERADLVRRQDELARWLRITEDTWRARDRDAEREARAKQTGAARLLASIDAETALLERLAQDEPLEDLELRQRELREEFAALQSQLGEGESAPPAALRDELARGLEAVQPALRGIETLLRDGDPGAAALAIRAASDELLRLWMLWAEPAAALARAAREQAAFVQELQQMTRLRGEAGAAGEEGLAVLARVRELLIERERRLASWLVAIERALAAAPSEAGAPSLFVERARARVPELRAQLERAAERIGGTGPQALVLATRAAAGLASLALEGELAKLAAKALAERLEAEQQRLTQGAAALLETAVPSPGIVESLAKLAGDLGRTLAWLPLRGDQDDQRARAEYLVPALAKEFAAAPTPPQGGEPAPAPTPDPQAEARRAALEAALASARAALARAHESCTAGPDPAAVEAMHAARVALRALVVGLADFDALLERSAKEQARLAALPAAIDARATNDADALAATRRIALAEALREQGVTTPLIEALRDALQAEAAAAASPAETGESAASPADELEQAARREALAALAELRPPAAEAARAAWSALHGAGDEAARLAAAAPQQKTAAELLAKAVAELARQRLRLVELAERIASAQRELLEPVRALRAGAAPRAADGTALDGPALAA
ncbi:MAG: VWA domain-containing protein, partial [Planctomycetes bacterium]|nr:VWA domain-containing protein [Planctomycetota bacterium]